MAQFTYDFDPHASNASNRIENESHSVPASMSPYRLLIPDYAPFFDLKDVVVTHNNKTLTRNNDYFITHRYFTGIQKTGQLLASAIWIINDDLSGTFKVSYNTLGGNFTQERTLLDDYLATRQSLPTTGSFEEIINDDPYFPDVDIQFDKDSFQDETDLQTALDEIATTIGSTGTGGVFEILENWYDLLASIIDESGLTEHANDNNNPHDVMWFMSGALKQDGIAQNASKVFGYAINALATVINAAGVTQTDLDNYVTLAGDSTLLGDIILDDAVMSIAFSDGSNVKVNVTLDNGLSHFYATDSVSIIADKDATSPDTKATLRAGLIDLSVVSTGDSQDDDSLLINGVPVAHTGNVETIIPQGSVNNIDINLDDTESLLLSGKGTANDPLKGEAVLEQATTSVYGIAKGTSEKDDTSTTTVAFAQATREINIAVEGKVDSDLEINGVKITDNGRFYAEDVGLGNVENISDMDMPLSDAQRALLVNYSHKDHTHPFDEMGVEDADEVTYGVAKLVDDPTSTSTTDALSLSAVFSLANAAKDIVTTIDSSVPSDAINITQYGGNNYLPVPVQGSYEGSGPQTQQQGMGVLVERNGDVVILRNGQDIKTKGVFYASAQLNSALTINSELSTATRYSPTYLPEGKTVVSVGRNTDDIMTALVEDAAGNETVHLILLSETFDDTKHVGCEVEWPLSTNTNEFHTHMPFVYGDYAYIFTMLKPSGGSFAPTLYRIALSQFVDGNVLTLTQILLTGLDMYGDSQVAREEFKLTQTWASTDIADKPMFLDIVGNHTNMNGYHSARSQQDISVKDNIMRVAFGSSTVEWYTGGVQTGYMSFSLTINLSSGALALDDNCSAPIYADSSNNTFTGELVRSPYRLVTAGAKGDYAANYSSRGYRFTVEVEPNSTITISSWYDPTNTDDFESADVNKRDMQFVNAKAIGGNYGSVCRDKPYSLSITPDKAFVYAQRSTGTYIKAVYSEDTSYGTSYEGFGPTDDRTTVDYTEHEATKHAIMITDASGDAAWGGGLVGTQSTVGVVNPETGAVISASQALIDSVQQAALDRINVTDNIDNTVCYITVLTEMDDICHVSIWYNIQHPTESDQTYAYKAVFDATVTFSGSVITAVELTNTITNYLVRNNARSTEIALNRYVNSSGAYDMEDEVQILLNTAPEINYVGWAAYYSTALRYDKATGISTVINNYTYDARNYSEGALIIPGVGLVNLSNDNSVTAILGTVRTDSDTYSQNDVLILHSSQVASGWNIYFTEEVGFFCLSTYFTMPVTNINLQEEFPDTYQNGTFYIYASIEGGDAHYTIVEQYVADSTTETFIGTCTTSDTQIVTLEVERATRLGDFRELEDHLADTTPHGSDAQAISAESLGLGLVENKGIRESLVNTTFEEVFDSWYRMSHHGDGIGTYPYREDETEAWTYDSETDVITNTTNSTTYIGMISPEDNVVGDFEFITEVNSTNGDDDSVGVVFAFVEVDGLQYTLSALCSGTSTHTTHFQIRFNHQQAGVLMFSATISEALGWDEIDPRTITVKRVGTVFTVSVTGVNDIANTAKSYTFDTKDYDYLSMFSGGVRFGYSASSQAYSTWTNILRPDEDGKNFYATQDLLLDNSKWSTRRFTSSGIVSDTDVKSNGALIFDVPIPSAYRGMPHYAHANIYQGVSGVAGNNGFKDAEILIEKIDDATIRFTTDESVEGATLKYTLTFFDDYNIVV